ncbi:short-chain dehydrogenase-like protein [Leptotrombidium deliense]|uniref:Dehydrogenase/reductase SDR family member 6 n=1 Tax=Leptotrombidium deliense TaxID=299467 RepID=A0A443S7L2_9ACAR|nr:short-chain dehydrogenase-like protein [Leptotrombidium deliense]
MDKSESLSNPGVVDTAFLIKFGLSEEVVEKLKKMYADVNPLRRLADPIEIAELVVFLASNDATYINGVNYNIDGGTVYENFPELQ